MLFSCFIILDDLIFKLPKTESLLDELPPNTYHRNGLLRKQSVAQFPESSVLVTHITRCSVVMHHLLSQETLDK